MELTLTNDDRLRLTGWAGSGLTGSGLAGSGLAQRARIILACAEGADNVAVARQVRCSVNTVGKWRNRFLQAGLDGLYDAPRPGRPAGVSADAHRVPSDAALPAPASSGGRESSAADAAGQVGAATEARHRVAGYLDEQIRVGAFAPGAQLPSLRTLARRCGVSTSTAHAAVQDLVSSGVLVAQPRRRITVASPDLQLSGCYLAVFHSYSLATHLGQEVLRGFERGISRVGGASVLWLDDSDEPLPRAEFSGMFVYAPAADDRLAAMAIPTVGNQDFQPGLGSGDQVRFDDFGGGRDATRHLLKLGHRRIAFLNWAARADHRWAERRHDGWRFALESIDLRPHLTFEPGAAAGAADGPTLARIAAREAVAQHTRFDALVGVDDWAIGAFVREWKDSGLDPAHIPPMIGFEELPEVRGYNVSSVRPPWDRLGEVAAELLWQRSVGQVTGASVERVVPMEVLIRLNSLTRMH